MECTIIVMMIWLNLGGDKHRATLHLVAICEYGQSGYIYIYIYIVGVELSSNRDHLPS